MKIHPVGAEMLHSDGQTADMTKLIVAFGNFANPPKNNTALINSLLDITTHSGHIFYIEILLNV